MLVLSRKSQEEIVISPGTPDEIRITVVQIDRNKIRLGFVARKDIPIYRSELLENLVPGATGEAG